MVAVSLSGHHNSAIEVDSRLGAGGSLDHYLALAKLRRLHRIREEIPGSGIVVGVLHSPFPSTGVETPVLLVGFVVIIREAVGISVGVVLLLGLVQDRVVLAAEDEDVVALLQVGQS